MRENCVCLLLVIIEFYAFYTHMRTLRLALLAALFGALTLMPNLQAQPLINIQTVTVGDAGYGNVADVFAIGKYEVTISQYSTFLNSVASVTSDSYIVDLWNANMTSDLNIAGISRSGSGTLADPYSYSVIGSGNRPISYVSWFDAARFANWMNNGATNGASTETGAYTLNGATSGVAVTKNAEATWWIPSEIEWNKAAYYKGGTSESYWVYPTQSDTAPGNNIGSLPNQANYYVGSNPTGVYSVSQSSSYEPNQNYLTEVGSFSSSASGYGTYDQGGNVAEWADDVFYLDVDDGVIIEARGLSGGGWGSQEINLAWPSATEPVVEDPNLGFRLASVPEPSTYALLAMSAAGALWWSRRKR